MKKLVSLAIACLIFTGCAKIEPGYVGIEVNNWGSQKGVSDFTVKTGVIMYNPFTTDIYKFPTFLQNVIWDKENYDDESITFNSTEGAVFNGDIAISFIFEAEKVPQIFITLRKDVEHITDVYMRSLVKDSFSRMAGTMKMMEIMGTEKQTLLQRVKEDLNNQLADNGIKFEMVSIVGALRVDEKVTQSINATIEASQRAIEAENKVRQAEAESNQKIAKAKGDASSILSIANAQAEANRIVAASLTPELVQYAGIEKWNGVLPSVTSNTVPFISVQPPKENQ
jgi:regulator of protease activity HflC (stomatin/prohibitin superfamily)